MPLRLETGRLRKLGREQAGNADYAYEFLKDLQSRLASSTQLTTDGHRMYLEAVGDVFGADIDYAMLVKLYGYEPAGEGRYRPPKCVGADKLVNSEQA